MTKAPYLHKEHYVFGDEACMQNTIDYWWNHINAKEYERFQEHFAGRICDIGCNIGMSSLFAARDPKVKQVVGVDVYDGAIEAARRYASFAKLDDKVTFIVQDFTLECSQLEAESFDGAISFHVLEHIYPEDLDLFTTNLWRILKVGGKVLISIPFMRNYNSPEHVTYFDKDTLHALFTKNGFDVLDIHLTDGEARKECEGLDNILTGLFVKRSMKEMLADLAHEQWSGWMRHMFGKGVFNKDGTWTMPARAVERWRRQMGTLYCDLPEEEKESDRREADKMLATMKGLHRDAKVG